MEDNGYGQPTVDADPNDVRIETDSSGNAKMEIFSANIAEKLLAGKKFNYVMMAKTSSGWHEMPG
jgi:hypothetical protein